MAALTVTRRRRPPAPHRGRHPKVRIVAGDEVLVLPFGPRGGTLGGWADPWEAINRPGRKPLVERNGDGLTTLGLEVYLARPDHQDTVEDLIGTLRRIAESGKRVTLVNLSPSERGPWRLNTVDVTIELRQEGTNAITRARVALGFLEASDANPKLGPVSGGKKGGKKNHGGGKGGKGGNRTRHYTTKKGDTLRKVSDKFYGTPSEWRRIAKASNVKHPNNMPVGRKLTIPPLP